jgi:outer membrane protein TolC
VQQDRARTVRLQIEQAYLALQGARERRPAFRARVAAARETWRLALGRYKAGVGTVIEVADARALQLAAEAADARAEADMHRTMAELWRALGVTGREVADALNPSSDHG